MQNWTDVPQVMMSPAKLRRHPLQEAHWAEVAGKSLTALESSVLSTGLQSPLLAYGYGLKKGENPWLLAGYRRQFVLLKHSTRFPQVPVRVMMKKMSNEEIELIILSNNLSMRNIEWRKTGVWGKKWNRFIKLTKKHHAEAYTMLENDMITPTEFSGRTGIDEKTAKKLKRVVRMKKSTKVNETRARIYPNSIDTTVMRGVRKSIGSIIAHLGGTNTATKNQVVKELETAVKTVKAMKS